MNDFLFFVKNYLRWCWRLKRICPWSVRYILKRPLTPEEDGYVRAHVGEWLASRRESEGK